ncbi:MAG: hypothetical protein WA110_06075 [Anaerolineaceae bacterium]
MNELQLTETPEAPGGEHPEVLDTRRKWISIGILIVLTVAGIIIARHFNFTAVEAFIKQHQSWTIVISLVLYLLLGLTVIPCIPLTVFLAYTLDPLTALLVNGVGMTLSSLVEYFTGKTIKNIFDPERLRAKLPEKVRNMPVEAPLFQLVSRFILPKPLGLISGALEVPLKTYIWTSFVVNTVGGVIISYGGLGIIKIF